MTDRFEVKVTLEEDGRVTIRMDWGFGTYGEMAMDRDDLSMLYNELRHSLVNLAGYERLNQIPAVNVTPGKYMPDFGYQRVRSVYKVSARFVLITLEDGESLTLNHNRLVWVSTPIE